MWYLPCLQTLPITAALYSFTCTLSDAHLSCNGPGVGVPEGGGLLACHQRPVVGVGARALSLPAKDPRAGGDPAARALFLFMFWKDGPLGTKFRRNKREGPSPRSGGFVFRSLPSR